MRLRRLQLQGRRLSGMAKATAGAPAEPLDSSRRDEVTWGEDAEEKLERGGVAYPGEQGAKGFGAGEQP